MDNPRAEQPLRRSHMWETSVDGWNMFLRYIMVINYFTFFQLFKEEKDGSTFSRGLRSCSVRSVFWAATSTDMVIRAYRRPVYWWMWAWSVLLHGWNEQAAAVNCRSSLSVQNAAPSWLWLMWPARKKSSPNGWLWTLSGVKGSRNGSYCDGASIHCSFSSPVMGCFEWLTDCVVNSGELRFPIV